MNILLLSIHPAFTLSPPKSRSLNTTAKFLPHKVPALSPKLLRFPMELVLSGSGFHKRQAVTVNGLPLRFNYNILDLCR